MATLIVKVSSISEVHLLAKPANTTLIYSNDLFIGPHLYCSIVPLGTDMVQYLCTRTHWLKKGRGPWPQKHSRGIKGIRKTRFGSFLVLHGGTTSAEPTLSISLH